MKNWFFANLNTLVGIISIMKVLLVIVAAVPVVVSSRCAQMYQTESCL